MKLIKLMIMIFALTLVGCDEMKTHVDETGVLADPRTDLVEGVRIGLHIKTYEEVQEKCGFATPVYGCGTGEDNIGHIWMYGWDVGDHSVKINVQFMNWHDIGAKCGVFFAMFGDGSCYDKETSTLYTYEYMTDKEFRMGEIGAILANEVFHLTPKNLYNREKTLGHEFMAHVMGGGDVWVFPWDVNPR